MSSLLFHCSLYSEMTQNDVIKSQSTLGFKKKKTGIVLKEAVIIVSEAEMFDSSVDLVDS